MSRYRTERHNVMGLKYTQRVRDVEPRQAYWVADRSGDWKTDRIVPVTVIQEYAPRKGDGRVTWGVRYNKTDRFEGAESVIKEQQVSADKVFPTRREALIALRERAEKHIAYVQGQIAEIDGELEEGPD